jgi:2-C-methyl-D-erythritol 4-phosphate cytidylyltransferase
MTFRKTSHKVHVIIPAGGRSLRFSGDIKKQFLVLESKTVLDHTILAFLGVENLVQIVVALPEADLKTEQDQNQNKSVRFVVGGESRAQSVYQAFLALSKAQDQDIVLIHDAARPLVDRYVILRVIQAVSEYGAAIPGVAVSDTIKAMGQDGFITETLERSGLRAAQTPQGFFYEHLKAAYTIPNALTDQYTDEAMLVEKMGVRVKIVEGSPQNLKITTPFDFEVAKVLVGKA